MVLDLRTDISLVVQVIVYDQGQVIESPSFMGRVGFAGMPWSADIILNSTWVSDAGVYRCVVSNPPETGDPGIGELILTVLGIIHHTASVFYKHPDYTLKN